MLPTSTQTPNCLKPEGWWCWFRLTSPPINQKNVHKLIMPCLHHYYESPHHTLQVGTCTFEGISLLWSPLPGKAIKLFFSTSPKTLSPRFNLVLGYRGWICLHHGSENIMGSVLVQCSYAVQTKSIRKEGLAMGPTVLLGIYPRVWKIKGVHIKLTQRLLIAALYTAKQKERKGAQTTILVKQTVVPSDNEIQCNH